jgi:hypothetical protein
MEIQGWIPNLVLAVATVWLAFSTWSLARSTADPIGGKVCDRSYEQNG